MERRFDAMARGSQRSGDDRAGREVAPPRRGGGLRLPGLKHWRRRRGFTQRELARRADLAEGYLWKVESGRRGCNPSVAHVLAELLEVDLQDLRTKYDAHEVQAASTGGAQAASGPARSRVAYRHVHQAYLKILLVGGGGLYLRHDGRRGDRAALRGDLLGRSPQSRVGEEAGDRVPRGSA